MYLALSLLLVPSRISDLPSGTTFLLPTIHSLEFPLVRVSSWPAVRFCLSGKVFILPCS